MIFGFGILSFKEIFRELDFGTAAGLPLHVMVPVDSEASQVGPSIEDPLNKVVRDLNVLIHIFVSSVWRVWFYNC